MVKFQRPRRYKRRPRTRKRMMPFSSKQVKAIKKLSVSTQDMKTSLGSLTSGNLLTSTSYYLSIEALGIVNGADDGERIGDRITVKDLEFRTTLNLPNPFSVFAHYNVRVLIVQFLDPASVSQFNSLDPLDFMPQLSTGGPTVNAKYKILHNKIVTVAPFSPHKTLVHRISAKDLAIKDIEFAFSGLGGSVVPIKGDIYYFLVPDVNSTITNGELLASTSQRLRYYG